MATNQTSVVDLPIKVLGMDSKQELLALTLIENKKLKNKLIRLSNDYKNKGDNVGVKNVNLLRIDSAKPDESKLQNASIIYLVYPDSDNFGEHFYLLINSSRQFEYHTCLHVNSIDLRKIWKDNFEQKFGDISAQLQLTPGFKDILNSWVTTYKDNIKEKKVMKDYVDPRVVTPFKSKTINESWKEIENLSLDEYISFVQDEAKSLLDSGEAEKYFQYLDTIKQKPYIPLFEIKAEPVYNLSVHSVMEKYSVPSDVKRLNSLCSLMMYDKCNSDTGYINERYGSELGDIFSNFHDNPCDSILKHPAKEAVEKYFDTDAQIGILHTWDMTHDYTEIDKKIAKILDDIKKEYGDEVVYSIFNPKSAYLRLKTKKKGINLHFYTNSTIEKVILIDIFSNGKNEILIPAREQLLLNVITNNWDANEITDIYFINLGALGRQIQMSNGNILPIYLMLGKDSNDACFFSVCQLDTSTGGGKKNKDANSRIVRYLQSTDQTFQIVLTMINNRRDLFKYMLPRIGIPGEKEKHIETISLLFDLFLQHLQEREEAIENVRREEKIIQTEKFSSRYLYCGRILFCDLPTDFHLLIRSIDMSGEKLKCTLYMMNRRNPDPVKVLFNTNEGKMMRSKVGEMVKNSKFNLSSSEKQAVYEFLKLS